MRFVHWPPGDVPLYLEAMIVPSESGISSRANASGFSSGTRRKVRLPSNLDLNVKL